METAAQLYSTNYKNGLISESRLVQSLFKNSKMPSKCQMFVEKSSKNLEKKINKIIKKFFS